MSHAEIYAIMPPKALAELERRAKEWGSTPSALAGEIISAVLSRRPVRQHGALYEPTDTKRLYRRVGSQSYYYRRKKRLYHLESATLEAAKQEVTLIESGMPEYLEMIEVRRSRLSWDRAFMKWEQRKTDIEGVTPSSVRNMRFAIESFKKISHAERPGLTTRRHVEQWLLVLEGKRRKASSIATYKKTVQAFFTWLKRNKMVAENPFADFRVAGEKSSAKRRSPRHILTAQQIASIPIPPEHRARMMAQWATGMRKSETYGVFARDVDGERMLLHVRRGKGGTERHIPISDKAVLMFLVELARKNLEVSELADNYGQALSEAAAKTDIGPVTTHLLRHARITAWADAGILLHKIKALAGHTSIVQTERYMHPDIAGEVPDSGLMINSI